MDDQDLAEACLSEAFAAFHALPPQPWIARNLALIDSRFAWIAFARGDLDAAEAISLTALERIRTLEHEHHAPYVYACDALTMLGCVARARGDLGRAHVLPRRAAAGSAVRRSIVHALVPDPHGRNAGCPR